MSGTAPEPPERSEEELRDWFVAGGRTLVALSGGVDSAAVAALGHSALGSELWTATLAGPAVASEEVRRAEELARRIGASHRTIPVDPLSVEGYRTNPSNRCYFCRTTESGALRRFGADHGIRRYVDGIHRDDLGDDRPGIRAMDEAGFEHPLLWAGWGKARVRAYARSAGLPNWDLPSDACLASRVPHGTPIDAATLHRIEVAESELRQRGYRRIRVRLEGVGARVEVDPEELPRLLAAEERRVVTERLVRLGFAEVTVDPRGYVRRANA